MTIRVIVADDQAMVRTGFGMIINAQPDMRLVGEAADGVEAVELARRLRPDVALLDIRMPRLDGLEALRLLAGPDVADPMKVVIDVVKLVARGLTNTEIATRLFISVGTVKTHLANVQTKLPARNRVEVVAWAWERHIVS
ncbi:response regulator transcription factor [Micromonospora sp. KC606]|uniref:response regulator transcription factor n=1 Tax=Micromonospora sp. KC606 TaxID=2530379 RepID=UPI001FB769C6|nr:response regulator transcription factor [Micromonospora sp. KC606]